MLFSTKNGQWLLRKVVARGSGQKSAAAVTLAGLLFFSACDGFFGDRKSDKNGDRRDPAKKAEPVETQSAEPSGLSLGGVIPPGIYGARLGRQPCFLVLTVRSERVTVETLCPTAEGKVNREVMDAQVDALRLEQPNPAVKLEARRVLVSCPEVKFPAFSRKQSDGAMGFGLFGYLELRQELLWLSLSPGIGGADEHAQSGKNQENLAVGLVELAGRALDDLRALRVRATTGCFHDRGLMSFEPIGLQEMNR